MKAIVLAAGYGRRMRPLTEHTHKTLLEVGGRTVIRWLVDGLLENGVRDVTVVTGYRAGEVEAHLAAVYPDLPIRFVHNPRFAETNNILSLALAFEHVPLDDDVMLLECDLVCEPVVMRRLMESPHRNVALVDRWRTGMDGTVVTVAADRITRLVTSREQGASFTFEDKYKTLNLYRFARDFCAGQFRQLLRDYVQAGGEKEYYEAVLGSVVRLEREAVHAEVLDGERWAELDDPNDLAVARSLFDQGDRRAALDRAWGGLWNHAVLDFCHLRNVRFPPPAIIAELRSSLPALLASYGSAQHVLERKLSYFLRCPTEPLVALNGASQAYPLLRSYLDGRRVLIPGPTFGEYARVFPGAQTYADAPGIDPERVLAAAAEADVVVMVTPNNPTGTTIPTDWIVALAEARSDRLVLVDESFLDFTGAPGLLSHLALRRLDNVVLLKSLSKPLGVPGLRLGFLYSTHPGLTEHVRGSLPIWSMNAVAEHFLEIIMKYRDELQASFEQVARDREELAGRLQRLAVVDRVYPSGGNFLLLRLRLDPAACGRLADALLERAGIYVKDSSARFPDGRGFLRIGVRWPDENDRLVAALEAHGKP